VVVCGGVVRYVVMVWSCGGVELWWRGVMWVGGWCGWWVVCWCACLSTVWLEERAHVKFVKAERQAYYDRRKTEGWLSIIIDGADQAAYGLPYHHLRSHSTQGAWKIRTHVMGIHAQSSTQLKPPTAKHTHFCASARTTPPRRWSCAW
jgi:hypothetical protein